MEPQALLTCTFPNLSTAPGPGSITCIYIWEIEAQRQLERTQQKEGGEVARMRGGGPASTEGLCVTGKSLVLAKSQMMEHSGMPHFTKLRLRDMRSPEFGMTD